MASFRDVYTREVEELFERGRRQPFLPENSPNQVQWEMPPGGGNIQPRGFIADGAIDIAQFAAGIIPPRVVAALPALPDTDFPVGSLVFLTTDEKLYRNTDGSTWSVAVDGADIIANSITAGQVAAGAIGTPELAADAVIANVINAGGTVIIDSDGIRIEDASGQAVLTSSGFGGSWLDFIGSRIYNNRFAFGANFSIDRNTVDYLFGGDGDDAWVINAGGNWSSTLVGRDDTGEPHLFLYTNEDIDALYFRRDTFFPVIGGNIMHIEAMTQLDGTGATADLSVQVVFYNGAGFVSDETVSVSSIALGAEASPAHHIARIIVPDEANQAFAYWTLSHTGTADRTSKVFWVGLSITPVRIGSDGENLYMGDGHDDVAMHLAESDALISTAGKSLLIESLDPTDGYAGLLSYGSASYAEVGAVNETHINALNDVLVESVGGVIELEADEVTIPSGVVALGSGGAEISDGGVGNIVLDAPTGGQVVLPDNTALRLLETADASLASTAHALQIGDSSGVNLIMDNNEIMARDNGGTESLFLQAEGGPTHFGGAIRGGAIINASFNANQDDWNPTGLSDAFIVVITGPSATRNITGIQEATDGTLLIIHNNSSFSVVLVHDSASSSTNNRIFCPGAANVTIRNRGSCLLFYSNTRWRVVAI